MDEKSVKNKKKNKEGRKRSIRKRKIRNHIIQGFIAFLGIVILVLLFLGDRYCKSHFLKGTVINDIDASNMTIDELESRMREYTLTIKERTKDGNYISEMITGDEIGVTVSNLDSLKQIQKEQSLIDAVKSLTEKIERNYQIDNLYEYIDEALESSILKLQGFQDTFYVKPVDAYISEYNSQSGYSIVKEIEGNELNQTKTRAIIRDAVDRLQKSVDLDEAGCYESPQICEDDQRFQTLLPQLNKYVSIEITYKFGDNNEVLNGETIKDWLIVDDEKSQVSLNRNKVNDYVASLRRKYDTIFRTREFMTSYGRKVTVDGGDYGWWMNYTKEQDDLYQMLENGESGERSPVYFQTAAAYGTQDYGNTYVEVNLTAQHLFLYVDGVRVLESDFVSGNASRGFDTPEGVYGITYKEQCAMLVGENYETPVSYWMPFNGNIGLHDAIWRDQFGRDIYLTKGSHGCVNLPYGIAKQIYGYVSKGTAVICYHLMGTESANVTDQSDQEKAQAVIDAIDNIGEVTKDSKKRIERAKQLYTEAKEPVRACVTNADKLAAALDQYAAIKKK